MKKEQPINPKLIVIAAILITISLILIFGCSKKTCYDCIAKDGTGKVLGSVQTCDAATRDQFLSNWSNSNPKCNPL